MFRDKSYQIAEWAFLTLLGVLACYYFVTVALYFIEGNVFGDNYDFNHYYKAAERLFNDPDNFYPHGHDRTVAFQGFTYPPLAIVMVIPFSFFDIYTGSVLWSLFCLLNVFVAAQLLVKIFEHSVMEMTRTQKATLILFLVATAPAMHNYIFLQVNFIILNTCLGYIYCVQQR